MERKSGIKIHDEVVQLDPHLIFQRLVTTGNIFNKLASIFCYECAPTAPALFEAKHAMK